MSKLTQKTIEQHDVIAKYLQGRLLAEEAAEFEVYLMDHPALLEQLELDDMMIRTMPQAMTDMKGAKVKNQRWWDWLFVTPLRSNLATFALCCIGFTLLYPVLNKHLEQSSQDAVMANIQHIFLAPMRGARDSRFIPEIMPLSADRYIEVTIQTSDEATTTYDISIINRASKATVMASRRFNIMQSGDIKLTLPTRSFTSGEYQLTAKPVNSQSEPELYYFSVRHE